MNSGTRLVMLAAGQGARLLPLTTECPKSMQPISGEPLLLRTLRQLRPLGFGRVIVVVGYKREMVAPAVQSVYPNVEIVNNPDYERDTNIQSTLLGLDGGEEPSLIFEADVVISDACRPSIAAVVNGARSVWFTHGPFRSHQLGGILRTDAAGEITDLRYTPRYEDRFKDYKKLLGLLFVGPHEMGVFLTILRAAATRTMKQYYMTPWCESLSQLPCRECDLAPAPAATFNTIEEYRRCRDMF